MSNVVAVNYEDEMKKSYIDYAMSVIISRALPDVRDGLKPVHRRILWGMRDLNNFYDKPHKKSARIVGDVMGKYHPHGDSSVYDAMVRLSQNFNMLHPLVDGHGNFGSIDGDSAAAMRYTESRLTPIAFELLQDLEKDVVDYRPNFDNTLKEPVVLPAKFPNLLVNGSTGIAVGMATNIPSHNLNETINACIALLKNPNITTKGLMKYIKGPDFPTGGIVANKGDLLNIYETGNGRIRIRAKHEIEDVGYGRKNIIITEIPFTLSGNKTKLIEDLLKFMSDRRLDEISEVRDESSMEGLRIVIEVKKGINIDNLINKLYKISRLEDTFAVNLLAIKDYRPKVFSLKEMIYEYVEFLKEINIKKINFDLNKNKERLEVLEGLIRAVDVIDLIIEIIRGSKDVKIVKSCLIDGITDEIKFKTKQSGKQASKLHFTEKQANAILALQLQRLVGLEINQLNEEFEELKKSIDYLNSLLNDEDKFNDLLREDLNRIKKSYGAKRKTLIDEIELPKVIKEDIIEEDVYVLIDRFNYIKVIDSQSHSRTNEETLLEYKSVIEIKNTDSLCIFTDCAEMHQIKIKDIELSKIRDRGIPIDNICDINGCNILLITPFEEIEGKLLFVTKKGYVKLVERNEFETNRKLVNSTKVMDDDELIEVKIITEEEKEILIISSDDRVLRFNIDEISIQKKNARGVVGMNLNKDAFVKEIEVSGETKEKKRKRGSKGAMDNISFV